MEEFTKIKEMYDNNISNIKKAQKEFIDKFGEVFIDFRHLPTIEIFDYQQFEDVGRELDDIPDYIWDDEYYMFRVLLFRGENFEVEYNIKMVRPNDIIVAYIMSFGNDFNYNIPSDFQMEGLLQIPYIVEGWDTAKAFKSGEENLLQWIRKIKLG